MNGLSRGVLAKKYNFPFCLAPMVGLSHVHLRTLVRSYLPEDATTIWPTEMLNSRKLPKEDLSQTAETRRLDSEVGLCPQILGNEETEISESVKKLLDWGAEGIDINMGCPVKKALRHNYGVALMGDANYAAEVVAMTVRHSSLPVSVKLRSGLTENEDYLLSFIKGLESAGASWITLHPRIASQKRRGEAKWDQIKTVRDQIEIPVIGNGDIQTSDDALDMLSETGCDMAMIGRAMTARPWIFWQLGERLGLKSPLGRTGPAPKTSEEEGAEYGRSVLMMLELMRQEARSDLALRQFRFFVKTGSPWLLFGHSLYAITTQAKDFDEMEILVKKFFSCPQPMSLRTELRC